MTTPFSCRQPRISTPRSALHGSRGTNSIERSPPPPRRAGVRARGRGLKIPAPTGGHRPDARDPAIAGPDLDVIMITGTPGIKGAVEAIQQGARLSQAVPEVRRSFSRRRRSARTAVCWTRSTICAVRWRTATRSRNGEPQRVMHRYLRDHQRACPERAFFLFLTVLIYGDVGTGKELRLARSTSRASARGGPLRAINWAAFPDTSSRASLRLRSAVRCTGRRHDRRRQDSSCRSGGEALVPRQMREHSPSHAS